MLATLLKPTGGRARVGGIRPRSRRATTSGGSSATSRKGAELYDVLTGAEFLDFVGGPPPALGRRSGRPAERARRDGSRSRRSSTGRIGEYSKGMKQKLLLIAALQHEPAVLLLDEPLDGLDVAAQEELKAILRERAPRGRRGRLLVPHPRSRRARLRPRGDPPSGRARRAGRAARARGERDLSRRCSSGSPVRRSVTGELRSVRSRVARASSARIPDVFFPVARAHAPHRAPPRRARAQPRALSRRRARSGSVLLRPALRLLRSPLPRSRRQSAILGAALAVDDRLPLPADGRRHGLFRRPRQSSRAARARSASARRPIDPAREAVGRRPDARAALRAALSSRRSSSSRSATESLRGRGCSISRAAAAAALTACMAGLYVGVAVITLFGRAGLRPDDAVAADGLSVLLFRLLRRASAVARSMAITALPPAVAWSLPALWFLAPLAGARGGRVHASTAGRTVLAAAVLGGLCRSAATRWLGSRVGDRLLEPIQRRRGGSRRGDSGGAARSGAPAAARHRPPVRRRRRRRFFELFARPPALRLENAVGVLHGADRVRVPPLDGRTGYGAPWIGARSSSAGFLLASMDVLTRSARARSSSGSCSSARSTARDSRSASVDLMRVFQLLPLLVIFAAIKWKASRARPRRPAALLALTRRCTETS